MGFPSVTIIGAGAVGTSYSGIIKDTMLYGRDINAPYFNHIKINNYTTDTEYIKKVDTIIFCVKAYDLYDAIKQYRNIINKECIIILLSNGMYHRIFYKRLLNGFTSVWAGFTTLAATRKDNNIFLVNKGRLELSRLSEYAEIPDMKGVKFSIGDYDEQSWKKGVINSLINPVCVKYDIKNGDILKNKDAYNEFLSNYDKLKNISIMCNRNMPDLESVIKVIKETPDNVCSSLQDKRNNRPSEMKYFLNFFEKRYKMERKG